MRRFPIPFVALLLASLLFVPRSARADEAPADPNAARDAFREGIALVSEQRWGDALAAFERAARVKQHALTSYNMGIAERALGRLTRARVDFAQALELDAKSNHTELPGSYADDARGLLTEIEARLVHVNLHLRNVETKGSTLTIDGRPVALDPTGRSQTLYAGVATEGAPLTNDFEVIVDPGDRELLLQKEGFTPVTATERFKPGSRVDLNLSLVALDATILVDSDRPGSVVRVQGLDMGVVPVSAKRPPGKYTVDVRSPGFVTYAMSVQLEPGGRSTVFAKLPKEPYVVTKQWWFWTAAAAVVAGTTLGVYLATRPPDPYDGGNTGWVAQAH